VRGEAALWINAPALRLPWGEFHTTRMSFFRKICNTQIVGPVCDRQANAALYRIVLTRLRWDPRTRTYLDRRISESKSRREAIGCLKRYIARELYPLLQPTLTAPAPAATTP
jgi:hypothetical protein